MAGKLFLGFDLDKDTSTTLIAHAAAANQDLTDWNRFYRPAGVYHNKGVATADDTIRAPQASVAGLSYGCLYGGRIAGGSYGHAAFATTDNFGAATAVTRATWATAQGHQLAYVRSTLGIAAEIYLTFDLSFRTLATSSLTSAYQPTNSWAKVFVWGDVEVVMQSSTIVSTFATLVFSVRNNGSQVATVTIAGVAAQTDWLFCTLHVKLDATTGLIDFTVNGIAQSAAYTGQNTVTTTPLASAPYIYHGPPVFDDGTTARVGLIDNIYLDDSAFPTGRPNIATFSLLADDTLTDASAVGTSPTTVVDALTTITDAKALRFSTGSGKALMTVTPPSTSTYGVDVLLIEMAPKRVTNRAVGVTRRIAGGYSLSGVETTGTRAKGTVLPFGSVGTPPETKAASAFPLEQIFETQAAAKMTITELATMKVFLASSAP